MNRCKYCGCTECVCHIPGFVTYRGYTLEQCLNSINKGWHNIVKTLWAAKPKNIKVIQVKEKYGSIRWYTDYIDEDYEKLIIEKEEESKITCEQCGKSGMIRDYGWLVCLCDSCYKEKYSA